MLPLLLACAGEPADERTPAERADAEARELWQEQAAAEQGSVGPAEAKAPEAVPSAQGEPAGSAEAQDAAPPEITFTWEGINTLYKSFFGDPALEVPLARALQGAIAGPPAVAVRYDPVAVRGFILLNVAPGTLLLPVHVEGDLVRVQDLAPLTMALDEYRQGLGGRYDLRLLNFRVGVELHSGTRTCLFSPAGDPPPDGRVVSPCVTVDGQPHCGAPSKEGVRFPPELSSTLRACLQAPT